MGFLSAGQARLYFILCRMSLLRGIFSPPSCCWPELFAVVWLTHESVRWEQAMQAAPPFTPSIRDSTEPESLHIQQGFYLNIYMHREETRVQYARVMVEGTCVVSKNINIRVVCTMHYFCSFFSWGKIYIYIYSLSVYLITSSGARIKQRPLLCITLLSRQLCRNPGVWSCCHSPAP